MKKKYILLSVLLFPLLLFSQDMILLKGMKTISADVLTLTKDSVSYIPSDPLPGTMKFLNRKEIFMIYFNTDSHPRDSALTENYNIPMSNSPGKLNSGGPANALYSVLYPGWGDYHVKEVRKQYWIKGALTYGLLGGSLIFKIKSKNIYNRYIQENKPNGLYSKANQFHKYALILAGAGMAIWISDLIYVVRLGCRNRRTLFNTGKSEKSSISFYLRYGYTLDFCMNF